MIVTDRITPNYIFKNGKSHKLIWTDPRFTVYKYTININRQGHLMGVVLQRAFHPNAKYTDSEEFTGVSSIYERPKNVHLCIPDIFKNKPFGSVVTKDMIKNLISNWNLDDSYYVPHPHLYTCEPKL